MVATWGEKNYPAERLNLFWRTFKYVEDRVFEEAVNDLIATYRAPPMLEEMSKCVETAKLRESQRGQGQPASFLGILHGAAKENKRADAEFVKGCLSILRRKLDGKLTAPQWDEACQFLESTADKISPESRLPNREVMKYDSRAKQSGDE